MAELDHHRGHKPTLHTNIHNRYSHYYQYKCVLNLYHHLDRKMVLFRSHPQHHWECHIVPKVYNPSASRLHQLSDHPRSNRDPYFYRFDNPQMHCYRLIYLLYDLFHQKHHNRQRLLLDMNSSIV